MVSIGLHQFGILVPQVLNLFTSQAFLSVLDVHTVITALYLLCEDM